MKRFFKPKGSPVDPTPYPLGPSAEIFTSSAQTTPDKGSGMGDHSPGLALPVPPKQARFLNLGHGTKDNVTPFPLGLIPSPAQPLGTDYGTQELVSVDIGQEHESLDKSFSADSKIRRRVSVKANDGRGMFGFSRKEKDKERDKDRIKNKDQGNDMDFERKARPRRASEQHDYGAVHAGYARGERKDPQDPALLSVHRHPFTHGEPPPIKLARQYSHDPPVFKNSAMSSPLPHRFERTANESKVGVLYPPLPLARMTSTPNDTRSSEEAEISSLKRLGHSGASSDLVIAEREIADKTVSGRVSPYSAASLQSAGLDYEAHTRHIRPFIQPRHTSRGSESSVGQSTAPEGLAVPSSDSHPQTSRRSMDSSRNPRSSDNERSGRPSFDVAYESRGGLRSMFSGKGSSKGENEMLQEIEDGKKKKGLFGLSAKFKDKDEDRRYGNKIWKGRSLPGAEHSQPNVVQTDNEHQDQAISAAVGELTDWARTGSFDRDAQLAHASNIFAANTHGTGQSPQPTFLLSGNDIDKREREQATKDYQDRTKDALKIEKRGRERLEKETAKAEKEAVKRKGEMGSVTWAISDLCSKAEGSDYPLILELCERISHSSEEVAKEAARAVRKIIKYGTQNNNSEQEKIMAMKIWLLGCMRCPEKHGFRAQMTSKRFLQSLEPLFSSEKEKTALGQDAFDRLRGTLSHLNYNFGDQKGSDSLRDLWMKIKTPREPKEGYPFGTVDPIYSMTDPMLRLRQRRPPHADASEIGSDEDRSAILPRIPNEQDQLANLLKEILTCKEHAKVLYSALIHATSSDFQLDLVVKEFYAICVRDQESLVSQLGWANAQAERAKKDRARIPPSSNSPSFENRLQILHSSESERSLAEEVFVKLLAANDELSQALKMHEEMEHDLRDDREMRYVQERSKNDTRMNIPSIDHHSSGQLGMPISNGKGELTQPRSPSPSRYQSYYPDVEAGLRSQDDRLEHVRRPYTATNSKSHTPESVPEFSLPRFSNDMRAGSPTRVPGKVQGPRPITEGLRKNQYGSANSLQSSHHVIGSGASLTRHSPLVLASRSSDNEAGDNRPAMPSAKALGKRRAEPMENPNFDPDDLWKTGDSMPRDSDSSSSGEEVFHYWELKQPTVYIYDAAKERAEERQKKTPLGRSVNDRDLTADQYLMLDASASCPIQIDNLVTHSVPRPPSSPTSSESGLQRRVSSRWNQWRRN